MRSQRLRRRARATISGQRRRARYLPGSLVCGELAGLFRERNPRTGFGSGGCDAGALPTVAGLRTLGPQPALHWKHAGALQHRALDGGAVHPRRNQRLRPRPQRIPRRMDGITALVHGTTPADLSAMQLLELGIGILRRWRPTFCPAPAPPRLECAGHRTRRALHPELDRATSGPAGVGRPDQHDRAGRVRLRAGAAACDGLACARAGQWRNVFVPRAGAAQRGYCLARLGRG
jgi:hypothetical protein